jgi:hypothetical protein
MWNLVNTTIAASIADSGMEYLTHQVRKRVGRWSNIMTGKDLFGLCWACPLYPRKRTSSGLNEMSAKGQKRT